MTTIFTHMRPDLDAAASVWAAQKFAGFSEASVAFVPGFWDGTAGPEGRNPIFADEDIAVDVPAGGKGIKGVKDADGTIHSAFASIISTYADEESQKALADLVVYVDAVDTAKAPAGVIDLNQVCQGLMTAALGAGQPMPVASATVVEQMATIFDGLYALAVEKMEAEAAADKAAIVEVDGVKVAINYGGMAATQVLYERGCAAVVFAGSNDTGHWMSASRGPNCKVNLGADGSVKALFDAVGEGDDFFAHPAGFLVGCGTAKAPRPEASQVTEEALAEAIAKTIAAAA